MHSKPHNAFPSHCGDLGLYILSDGNVYVGEGTVGSLTSRYVCCGLSDTDKLSPSFNAVLKDSWRRFSSCLARVNDINRSNLFSRRPFVRGRWPIPQFIPPDPFSASQDSSAHVHPCSVIAIPLQSPTRANPRRLWQCHSIGVRLVCLFAN